MHLEILQAILILLLVSVGAVALFRRLRLPPIIAYLFIGAALGPWGLGLIDDTENTRYLAEFGVVFMLFSVGLEFSLPQLIAMRGVVFGLGGLQVLLTTTVSSWVALQLGVSLAGAILIGGVMAMSSTAIVGKQLTEQLEQHSRHGRHAMGILLFQDLAVVPFLAVLPMLESHDGSMWTLLGMTLFKASVVLVGVLLLGYWLMRPLFHEIARARSAELFTLTVLLVTLASAWLTHSAGLSFALGAFLAGMMLSETEFRHQIEADIRPFRDVLLGLFFITVGMLINLHALPRIWPWVLLLTAALILFKFAVVFLLARAMGSITGVAIRTAVVLAQGGEFGFALLSLAMNNSLINVELGQVVLMSVILSMSLAPLLIHFNGAIAKVVCATSYGNNRTQMVTDVAETAAGLEQHVLICGFGRIGQNIARFLEEENIPYMAVDLDPLRVREARTAGERVNYGDATHLDILQAAGIKRARLLIITYDDVHAAQKILGHTTHLKLNIPVLVRTSDDRNLEVLQQAGATEVVPETLEASLMLASHMLLLLDTPAQRVNQLIEEARGNRYQLLRGFFVGQEGEILDEEGGHRHHLVSLTLPHSAHAVGQKLGDMALDELEVLVNAVRRRGIRGDQPTAATELCEGDVLVLYGTPEALERAQNRILCGL